MTATVPVLRLEAAERIHGHGALAVRALGPLDLAHPAGELLAVMGPSGSGKSTLLHLAGGLDRPSAGRVLLFGRDLESLSRAESAALRRRELGFVFQDLNLIPGLTAIENVSLPLELDGWRLADARRLAAEALAWVGLAELALRFPDDLSGGEQQRVAIARATVGPRRLILCDEPTGSLDSVNAEVVLRLLRAFCDRGGSAILATHDPLQAAWADRILILRDGRCASLSPADQAGAADLFLARRGTR